MSCCSDGECTQFSVLWDKRLAIICTYPFLSAQKNERHPPCALPCNETLEKILLESHPHRHTLTLSQPHRHTLTLLSHLMLTPSYPHIITPSHYHILTLLSHLHILTLSHPHSHTITPSPARKFHEVSCPFLHVIIHNNQLILIPVSIRSMMYVYMSYDAWMDGCIYASIFYIYVCMMYACMLNCPMIYRSTKSHFYIIWFR